MAAKAAAAGRETSVQATSDRKTKDMMRAVGCLLGASERRKSDLGSSSKCAGGKADKLSGGHALVCWQKVAELLANGIPATCIQQASHRLTYAMNFDYIRGEEALVIYAPPIRGSINPRYPHPSDSYFEQTVWQCCS